MSDQTGSTRRDLLRRTAIAGGALWASPMVLGFGTAAFAEPSLNCCQFSVPVPACTHFAGLPKAECLTLGGLYSSSSFCCATPGGPVTGKCVPNAHPEWCPNGKEGVPTTAKELDFS